MSDLIYLQNTYSRNTGYLLSFPKDRRLDEFETLAMVNNTAVTKQKISSFKYLPSGWHYGEGIRPADAMIDAAHDWHNRIASLGFTATNAFPGVAGEIMISGKSGDHDVEIILETNGTLSFEHSKEDETVTSIERGSAGQVEEALSEAAGELWNTSGLFISDISNQTRIVSLAWHSEITAVALPSFYMNAFKYRVDLFVGTSERIIPTLLENPQSFGYWTDRAKIERHQSLLPAR